MQDVDPTKSYKSIFLFLFQNRTVTDMQVRVDLVVKSPTWLVGWFEWERKVMENLRVSSKTHVENKKAAIEEGRECFGELFSGHVMYNPPHSDCKLN